MFNLDTFLSDCHSALAETNPMLAIQELIGRAVATPMDLDAAFGPYSKGGTKVLHHGDQLTVLHIVWPPGISIFPHDHLMWAAIGIHAGIEDNTFFRRTDAGLDTMGTVRMAPGDARSLPADAIHAVANPESLPTAALHVYGGDFFAAKRSQFDEETHAEKPYDKAHANRVFEQANERWLGQS
ncbi:MAG: putative metal-dependent enzyme (double-stranded beta helix superfamily) [Gammaproteobacteria bacterium]|jgi:predicted metal-dependent enzyme (double-stranded beta helix superfamily)